MNSKTLLNHSEGNKITEAPAIESFPKSILYDSIATFWQWVDSLDDTPVYEEWYEYSIREKYDLAALSKARRVVFDIESDGLYDEITKVWIVRFKDIDTHEKFVFYPFLGDADWILMFKAATLIAGHNIIGYDLIALHKVFPEWEIPWKKKIYDTMLMSQAQDYRRFGMAGHSLEQWGLFLGLPKIEFTDFSKFVPEMDTYCERDVDLNLEVLMILIEEYQALVRKAPGFRQSLVNEHKVAIFAARAEERGWLFNHKSGLELKAVMEAELKRVEDILEPMLIMRVKPKDKEKGEVLYKKPKLLKNGNYDHHTCRWFGIDPESAKRHDRLVEGAYTRFEYFYPKLSNDDDVKRWLFTIGWEPDEWNYKEDPDDPRKKIQTSPKLSEASLHALGDYGVMLDSYNTLASRYGILKGWLENTDSNGRVHGGCFTIATPTGRARHSVIVNVPGGKKPWAKEIRSLFIATPGHKIIGADSSGNQFRALCHYLDNDEYTAIVLEGDVHQENADLLTAILREIEYYNQEQDVPRDKAKPFIYAFLFGGGGEKLSLIVISRRNKDIGNKLKNEFIKRVPGLKDLVQNVNDIYFSSKKNGDGYIIAADGRRIYCESNHKLLNYLLQGFEAISCKAAVAYAMDKLDEEGIPWEPLIWYHDEFEIEVPEEYAERALEISIEAYQESGKPFGMVILDGAGRIGDNWFDVH